MYTVVDDAFEERLKSDSDRSRWLFLEPHPDFPGRWLVQSFDPGWFFDLKDVVGPYRVVAPSGLDEFLDAAREYDYEPVFFEDPVSILGAYEGLNVPPPFEIHSDFEDTINGLLPFQVQGYNFLRDQMAGIAMWSTGTGKTVLATALLKYHVSLSDFDTALFVVKSHNKVNTQRAIERLGGIESIVIKGSKNRRRSCYRELTLEEGQVAVTNYEKFRTDHKDLLEVFDERRVLCVWDEMPNKLKTRTTQVYTGVHGCLFDGPAAPQVDWDRRRAGEQRHYLLSATPIENDPEDVFNCVRLMDPRIYGTVERFRKEYVTKYSHWDDNKPEEWHKLDKMGLKIAHITHQVDKEDPDIAKQFPAVIEEPVYIDWEGEGRRLYDKFVNWAETNSTPVAAISLCQMLCDAPSMLENSAALYEVYKDAYDEWEEQAGPDDDDAPHKHGSQAAQRFLESLDYKLDDEYHPKLLRLRELLREEHAGEKVVLYSTYNEALIPILGKWLDRWNVSYVRYTGTPNQRQQAEDDFRDTDVRVFLSSDAGSDSLNLEAGSVVIHYDLPWKWSTFIQRQNRIHRVSSKFQTVRFRSLMMADSVEERKAEIVAQKYQYHQGVFKGTIADQSASARMTKGDLLYILRGHVD